MTEHIKCPYITQHLECMIGAFGNALCMTNAHTNCGYRHKFINAAKAKK